MTWSQRLLQEAVKSVYLDLYHQLEVMKDESGKEPEAESGASTDMRALTNKIEKNIELRRTLRKALQSATVLLKHYGITVPGNYPEATWSAEGEEYREW